MRYGVWIGGRSLIGFPEHRARKEKKLMDDRKHRLQNMRLAAEMEEFSAQIKSSKRNYQE